MKPGTVVRYGGGRWIVNPFCPLDGYNLPISRLDRKEHRIVAESDVTVVKPEHLGQRC